MRIYRPHRGNFDAWRKYEVLVDGQKRHRIADGEFLEVLGNDHVLLVSVGGYDSGNFHATVNPDEVVVCELAANPRTEEPSVRVSVLSEADAQQKVLRFDRPPYVGGRLPGLAVALLATAMTTGFFLAMLVWCVGLLVRTVDLRDVSRFLIVVVVGTPVWATFGFIAACGIRSFYYYFRMPQNYRH